MRLLYLRSESCRETRVNYSSVDSINSQRVTHIDLQHWQRSRDLESRKIRRLVKDAVLGEEGEAGAFEDVEFAESVGSTVRMTLGIVLLKSVKADLERRTHEELRWKTKVSSRALESDSDS